MTLALYFAKRFLISFIRVFLGIVLLVLLFDFLTNLNRLNGIENQVWNALILSFFKNDNLSILSYAINYHAI
jgi:lipopolysaccharide export system permease protein